MKKICLHLTFIFFTCICLSAQDTITLSNHEQIIAHIIEQDSSFIHYKLFNSSDNSMESVFKYLVTKIAYHNGNSYTPKHTPAENINLKQIDLCNQAEADAKKTWSNSYLLSKRILKNNSLYKNELMSQEDYKKCFTTHLSELKTKKLVTNICTYIFVITASVTTYIIRNELL